MMDNIKYDSLLIKAVQSYPCLYKKLQNKYTDHGLKRNSWQKVAEIIGFGNGEDAEKRFKSLREQYSRYRRRIPDPDSPRNPIYEAMKFMDSFMKRRVKHRSKDLSNSQIWFESFDPEHSYVLHDDSSSPSSTAKIAAPTGGECFVDVYLPSPSPIKNTEPSIKRPPPDETPDFPPANKKPRPTFDVEPSLTDLASTIEQLICSRQIREDRTSDHIFAEYIHKRVLEILIKFGNDHQKRDFRNALLFHLDSEEDKQD